MLETLLPSLPTTVIMAAVTLGGLWVFRRTYVKQLGEMQEKIISAQEKQISILTKKVQRLEGVLSTLQYTLKERRRLHLDIKDDFVIITDERTGTEITAEITDRHPTVQKDEKKEE
jgi:hypothetical protein